MHGTRVVVPDRDNAQRLTALAAAAFQTDETGWTPKDFLALGGLPRAALLSDTAFENALLILQLAADEAEILNVGVVPAARRQGLGRALLAGAEDLARALGTQRIFLEVATDNTPARALYAAAGYTQVGQRPAYYLRPDGTRQDALVLARSLG